MSSGLACQLRDDRLRNAPPAPRPDWAMFLDIDGTLLDIASRPEEVVVPAALPPLLARTARWLGGALALVSGRPLSQIDALMAPLVLPCAGEHGAVLRLPGGRIETAHAADAIPAAWRERLVAETSGWKGVLVESKPFAVAVHYRLAPERAEQVHDLVRQVVSENPGDFEILPARCAYEIRNRRFSKAAPVVRMMSLAPFEGRVPVFIGDDVTDRDGFRAALAMGGLALEVHESFDGKPSQVLAWLDEHVPASE